MSEIPNPQKSFVISASAGSGKTYQLVRRYLLLAGAQAEPRLNRLLTVTFTRKAAAEMKQRIIEEASRALISPPPGVSLRPLALERARHILRNSQSMRVMTMDSLFSWLAKRFSLEAGLPIGAEIAGESELDELGQTAWFRLLNRQENRGQLEETAGFLEGDLEMIRRFMKDLYRKYRPTLYSNYGDDLGPWRAALTVEESKPYLEKMLAADIQGWLEDLLGDPLWKAKPEVEKELRDYLRRGSLAGLLSSAFFKPNQAIWPVDDTSGIVFSVNRRRWPRALKEKVDRVDGYLRRYTLSRKVSVYNRLIENLIGLYGHYEWIMTEIKKEQGLIDFADITISAFRLLQDPGIAFTLQSGIQHLLIDEFQDTNLLQWKFFYPVMEELLSGAGLFDFQSFFAVGDQKQSIYGFREADYTLFQELITRAHQTPELNLVTLHTSFRSSPLIVDFVNTVFSGGGLPAFAQHRTEVPAMPSSVTIYPLITSEEGGRIKNDRYRAAAAGVARSIDIAVKGGLAVAEKVSREGSYRARSANFRDIAVIYRTGLGAVILENELARWGIPCRREETGGFYQRREIRDCRAFLDFLADPENALALSTLLRSPLLGISEESYASLLAERDGGDSLWDAFRANGPVAQVKILQHALRKVGRVPLVQIVESFFQRTAARLHYRIARGDELSARNLDKLIDLLASLSARGVHSIREFRNALVKMSEADETRMAGGARDCVRLMTVHKAKGLEFKILYIFDAAYALSRSSRPGSFILLKKPGPSPSPLVYLPPQFCAPDGHPDYDSWKEQAAAETRAEELRLLYVAVTRAAQHLFVSAVEPGQGKPLFYGMLVEGAERLAGSGSWKVARNDHAGQAVVISLRDETVLPPLDQARPLEPEVVDPRIFSRAGEERGTLLVRPSLLVGEEGRDEGKLSTDFLIPGRYRVLGLAVHRVLENWCRGRKISPEDVLSRMIEREHPDRRWVEREMKKDLGTMKKIGLFSRLRSAKLKTEVSILDYLTRAGEPDQLVTGVIDLLAVFPGRVEFYDYKTVRLREGREEAEGERFRPQMEIYAHALKNIFTRSVSGYLIFTATGKIVKII